MTNYEKCLETIKCIASELEPDHYVVLGYEVKFSRWIIVSLVSTSPIDQGTASVRIYEVDLQQNAGYRSMQSFS